MRARRILLVVLVALSVLVAGCSGGDGGLPSADELTDDTASALSAVETYSIDGTLNQTQRSNNQEVESQMSYQASIDRSDRAFAVTQEAESGGQQLESQSYLVDGVVYQSSAAIEQQYGAEWVRSDATGNVSELWRAQDELQLMRVMLENASVNVTGTAEVDGTDAVVADVDADGSALATFLAGGSGAVPEIPNASATLWIDRETDRLVRADGTLEREQNVRGRELTVVTSFDERFSYDDVDVSLPSAATEATWTNETSASASA